MKVNLQVQEKMWLYNPGRQEGLSSTLVNDREARPYYKYILEKLSDVTYRTCGTRRSKVKVVHADRLWRYHMDQVGTGGRRARWTVIEESLGPATGDSCHSLQQRRSTRLRSRRTGTSATAAQSADSGGSLGG